MKEKKLQNLPLGLSDFTKIIDTNSVYVDKTELIYKLITGGEYYFLSRPRRFGKSLLVSTLHAIFAGKKELFKNLWIYNSDYSWQEHPVIRFNFALIGHRTEQDLIRGINIRLDTIIKQHDLDVPSDYPIESKFELLIAQLAQNNKVVILVDEYDKPILDHIDNVQEARKQREVLRRLYGIIKDSDEYVRFVFLTGVSKFSKTSVFSGFNNLRDITLSDQFSSLLGYSPKEINRYFPAHLEKLAQANKITIQQAYSKLASFYDGYKFSPSGRRMYNPFSVLSCLTDTRFSYYWFETATPTFLIKLLQKNNYDLESALHPTVNEASLGSFEPDNIPITSLLLQTGYLTIKKFYPKKQNYTLAIPNKEVLNGFTVQLVDAYTQLPANRSVKYAHLITRDFITGNMRGLQEHLQDFCIHAPYVVQIASESQLQFVLYSIFSLMGVAVDPEVMTSSGRADLVVELPKRVYVIELKFNGSAEQALEQINKKKYYNKFVGRVKNITLVGINFEHETKTVSLMSARVR